MSPTSCAPGPGPSSPAGVPDTYEIPDVDPTRLLSDAVRDFPDGVAVRDATTTLDWAALDRLVRDVANALRDVGVGAGTLVAVPASRTVLDVAAPLAVWRCGGVVALAGPVAPQDAHVADMVVAAAEGPLLPGWSGDIARVSLTPTVPRPWHRWRPTAAMSVAVSVVHDSELPDDARTSFPAGTALVTVDEAGRPLVVDHLSLMAAAFSVRLWVPDMVAGEEAMLLRGLTHANVALVLLPALLVAATTVVGQARDPVATAVAEGVTVLVTTGSDVTRQPTATTAPLRVVLHHGPVPSDIGQDLRRATGARVCRCDGVAAANWFTHAQPVYGRVVADLDGLSVTNLRSIVVDPAGTPVAPGVAGRRYVAGPQVIGGGWLDTTPTLGPTPGPTPA